MELAIPRTTQVAAGLASVEALPPNGNRLSVTFSAGTGASYWISFGQEATVDGGIRMTVGADSLQLNRENFGDAIRGSIHIIADGAVTVPVTEVYEACPCKGWGDNRWRDYVNGKEYM